LVAVPLRLIQSTARRFSGKKRDAGTAHPADAEENHDPQSAARPTSNQTLTQQPHVENQRSLRMTVGVMRTALCHNSGKQTDDHELNQNAIVM
jgi:hypothetical protein